MPVAMERVLESVADKKGLTGKERDAFIYGTMRKTGWKPKQEVDNLRKKKITMKTRLDRIIALNATADHVLNFMTVRDNQGNVIVDDELYDASKTNHPFAKTAAVGAVGAGGYLGGRALVNKFPTQAAAVKDVAGAAYDTTKGALQKGVAYGKEVLPGISTAVKSAGSGIGSKAMSLLEKLKGIKLNSRQERLVALNAIADEVLRFDNDVSNRSVERSIVGNPLSILIHGQKGKRLSGFADAWGNRAVQQGKGALAGTAAGAGAGAGAGALLSKLGKRTGQMAEHAKLGGLVGALGGLTVGAGIGAISGNVGKRATQIYRRSVVGDNSGY